MAPFAFREGEAMCSQNEKDLDINTRPAGVEALF
jgi:hypothetical protein